METKYYKSEIEGIETGSPLNENHARGKHFPEAHNNNFVAFADGGSFRIKDEKGFISLQYGVYTDREPVNNITLEAAREFASALDKIKEMRSIKKEMMIEKDTRKEENEFDSTYNENGEGYNPYR